MLEYVFFLLLSSPLEFHNFFILSAFPACFIPGTRSWLLTNLLRSRNCKKKLYLIFLCHRVSLLPIFGNSLFKHPSACVTLHLRFLRSADCGPAARIGHWPVRRPGCLVLTCIHCVTVSSFHLVLALPSRRWLNAVWDGENVVHGGKALFV